MDVVNNNIRLTSRVANDPYPFECPLDNPSANDYGIWRMKDLRTFENFVQETGDVK